MKLKLPDTIHLPQRPRRTEHAQVRLVVLTLISFLLGVTATTFWFRLNPPRLLPEMNSQISAPSEQPAAEPPPSGANPPARPFVETPVPVSPAAVEEVKKALPDYASMSLADGEQMLRDAALKKVGAAVNEFQSQVTKAEDELGQAKGKSPAEQQAAMKHFQQVQTEQSQKLQQIAGQLPTQIAALRQLKGAAQ